MTIEFDYRTIDISGHTGYGNASRQLIMCMKNQGDLRWSPGSSIMLNFCMPPTYKFAEQTIGYTPWESTEVPDTWIEPMSRVDAMWSPTSWSAEVLSGISGKHVDVLPHPIEPHWAPKKRKFATPFTFIHVGEPAIRKGGDLVLQAWHKRFANNPDFRLIFKCIKFPMCRIKDRSGSIVASPSMYTNTRILTHVMSVKDMAEMYYGAHCMVYPTRGEGFGLIPFEAIATGLPTIVTNAGGTADFANYAIPLDINGWVKSASQEIHPGLWIDHNVDEIIDKMLYVYQNYGKVSEEAYTNAQRLHEDFSLEKVGQKAHSLLSNHL